MCGRASLTRTEKELEKRFKATFYSEELERYNPLPNYNVAPTNMHPVLTNQDQKHLFFFRWGLIPFWADNEKIGYKMINARSETVAKKPAFRAAFKRRRCLVPFDGFYEWKKEPGGKQPYRVVRADGDIFCIAGLWEKWDSGDGETIHSFTLITQEAAGKQKELHDRMPALLLPEHERTWLDNEIPAEGLLDLIAPYPDEDLDIYKVSKTVNNVRNNSEELIKEINNR